MPVFKNYDGEIIDFPLHEHKVEDTVGQRYIGSAEYPDSINDFRYTDYSSGELSGSMTEEVLGNRNVKVLQLVGLQNPTYGEISIQINNSNIDMSSKYVLYLSPINDANVNTYINSENIKFGVNYPYDFSEDVQHTMKKINNIDEFGYADGLYEITFSGARAPSSIYLSINVTPINTAMELPFLKISLRKIEYVKQEESTAFVTTTEDGFMTIVDKADVDNLYDQSFDMMTKLKSILYVKNPTNIINLIDGATFNKALKSVSSTATSVVFTKTAIPSDKLNSAILISNENNENKAYMYLNGTIIYISPERANDVIIAPQIASGMFMGCSSLTSINFTNFVATGILSMANMFSGCSKLTTITGLSNFNTSRVVDMYGVFEGCAALTTVDLSTWDVSSVTTMYNMFKGCTNLATIQVSRWDLFKLINTTNMFNGCTKLSFSMVITNPNATQYANMFTNCSTVSPAKFVLGYSGTSLKTLATNMIATKSTTSNVILPAIFVATVTNAAWNTWAGGASYSITNGMTVNITGDVGTLTYTWNVYKVYLDNNTGTIKTTKVLTSKTNNTVTIAEYKTLGLEYVNSDVWGQRGYDGHDTLAGYVTVKNVTSKGTETQVIYVGDTYAKKYIPV